MSLLPAFSLGFILITAISYILFPLKLFFLFTSLFSYVILIYCRALPRTLSSFLILSSTISSISTSSINMVYLPSISSSIVIFLFLYGLLLSISLCSSSVPQLLFISLYVYFTFLGSFFLYSLFSSSSVSYP